MELRTLELADRSINVEVYMPESGEAAPGILLLHELYGLVDWNRQSAADLCYRRYPVCVPDLYTDGASKYCISAMVHAAWVKAGVGKNARLF